MGKFENVPELTGTENYDEWQRQMEHLLLGEGVYNHISNGTDPTDFIRFMVEMLKSIIPSRPSGFEKEEIQSWIKDDGLVKSIILRKVSSTILSITPDDISITVQEIWTLLANLYN